MYAFTLSTKAIQKIYPSLEVASNQGEMPKLCKLADSETEELGMVADTQLIFL